MPALDMQAIANYSAVRIVDSLAEGTAVCAFAALVLRLSRRQNAAARFGICLMALLAIAVSPLTRGLWASSAFSQTGSHRPALVVPESWALYLFSIWAALAALHLLGVGKALLHLHRLRRSCVMVDVQGLDPIVQDTLCRGNQRQVSLSISERVRVPTAIGLFKPGVVLPKWVLEELPAAELNQVLLHELAHLRRYDDWTNFAQQLVRALFFFHPAVWWIEKKMSLERELACDDAVLAETNSPRAYAECLAHLAERSFMRRSIALAQAALGKLSETSQRVAQILDVNRPRAQGHTWKPALVAAAGVVLVCGALGSASPDWIAFQDSAPAQASLAAPPQSAAAPPPTPVKMASYVSKVASVADMKFKPQPKTTQSKRLTASRVQGQKTSDADLIHLARAKTTQVPVTETLFVVIQRRDPNAPEIYQIQMWRVTVLHTQADPSAKAPSKT